jgi:exonuclease III
MHRQWHILCWNIRGINSEDKHNALRTHIDSSGCAIICLQETKREAFEHSYIRKFCPRRFDKFIYFPSDGNSGGLIVIWNSAIFKGELVQNFKWATAVKFSSTQSICNWYLANIYGPCIGDDRENFVQWMYDLQINDTDNWILIGDYNFYRSPIDRNRGGGNMDDMLLFNDIIRAQNLVDLPLHGATYTWSNMQSDPLLERLDWFLTLNNWTTAFPNTTVKALPRPVSDHVPCLVSIQSTIPKSSIFRFENYWIHHPGFKDTVSNAWQVRVNKSNAADIINEKLKNVRRALIKWSKSISNLTPY